MLLEKLIKKVKGMPGLSKREQEKVEQALNKLKNQKLNIMIIGGTGVGKSSTINALFKGEVAKIGINPSPETMEIKKFKIDDNITIWDSPGLGDGIRDEQHIEKITKLLHQKDEEGSMFIDCVLVVVSASSKDLGTEYNLINEVLIPNLGANAEKRIIVAINKSDEAISERYWDKNNNKPSQDQINYLEEKIIDIQNRIYESTNIDIKPMYYKAGYRDENFKDPAYKIDELMIFILEHIPAKKVVVAEEGFGDNKNDNVIDKTVEIIGNVLEKVVKGIGGLLDRFFSWFD